MARYQLISSLLLLTILVASTAAQAPRRLRLQLRRRQQFARQEVAPTPYPSADELKPEEPALIYGPPPSTDVDELPAEQEPDVNSFQPDAEPQPEPETSDDVDVDVDAEELDTDENSVEATTQAAAAPARLRINRQRLAKLQLAKAQPKRLRLQPLRQRQRIARLEELSPAVAPVAAPVPVAAAAPVPQFYYVGAQQPYVVAYNAAPQQLGW
ncbi:DNA translocase FtsK 1 [Drosophila nasuta]|uniref:DNA translocase FtsK 1 n=1 Tax=Drosophila nasuta TaxID=42062 RepID=UPI00295ED859|nr:DNA translocase FtsK 1 [Drosophila nasuta]